MTKLFPSELESSLDKLPLFASDQEIAEAVVGKTHARKWIRERLPMLEKQPGFPKIDSVHGGRAVPLVRLFYANYLGLPRGGIQLADGQENEGAWRRSRRRA